MTKMQIAGALVSVATATTIAGSILDRQQPAPPAPQTATRRPEAPALQPAGSDKASPVARREPGARGDTAAQLQLEVQELIGTWQPVLTDDARRELLNRLGASADDPKIRARVERAQKQLEERRVEFGAGSITISQPGAAPLRHSYRLLSSHGSRAELLLAARDGGAPQRVALQLVAADQLLATLSGTVPIPTMTLRRVPQ